MKSPVATLIYGFACLMFTFWTATTIFAVQHTNKASLYAFLQSLWYLIVASDLIKKRLLESYLMFGFVYKSFLFLLGLKWFQDLAGQSIIESTENGIWSKVHFEVSAMYIDLMAFLTFLIAMGLGILAISIFVSIYVCIFPLWPWFVSYQVPTEYDYPKILDFKESFRECAVVPDGNCCICLCEFDDSTVLAECEHCFHEKCIWSWISKGGDFCPYCKRQFNGIQPIIIEIGH